MARRRLAVVGCAGVVSIALIAGVLWVRHLEQRIALLEQSLKTVVASSPQFRLSPSSKMSGVPVGNAGVTVQSLPAELPNRASRGGQLSDFNGVPDGTTSSTINGRRYYLLPLASSRQTADGQ